MSPFLSFSGRVSDALDPVVDFLPRLGGAIAVLVIGLFLARYLSKLLTRLMLQAKIDQMGDSVGLGDSLARVGLSRSISRIVAGIVRIFLSMFVVVTAVGLLGVKTLEEPINELILFLPQLLVAIAIVFLGVIIAGYVSDWVTRVTSQMGIEGPLGAAAGALVVGVFVVVAAAQAGIPTSLFIVLIAILVGAAALTITLAFGLGGRSVAQQITAGRYLGDDLKVGQSIRVSEVEGTIARFESSHVVLTGGEGETIRVPNSTVMESVVVVLGGDGGGHASPY
jgi:small-conductance mechanosensitive channel